MRLTQYISYLNSDSTQDRRYVQFYYTHITIDNKLRQLKKKYQKELKFVNKKINRSLLF